MVDIPTGFRAFTAESQARMRATRRLFLYWSQHYPGGRFRRVDIDPAAIIEILPLILLGDIEPAPFRVRFRLVGTSIAAFSRMDFTGRYLDELDYGTRDSIDWQACYRQVHGTRGPVIGNNEIRFVDGGVSLYEFAVMPLWREDDPAGSFIACESYEGFDRLHIEDLEPVLQR